MGRQYGIVLVSIQYPCKPDHVSQPPVRVSMSRGKRKTIPDALYNSRYRENTLEVKAKADMEKVIIRHF